MSESVTGVGIELSQTLVWTAKNCRDKLVSIREVTPQRAFRNIFRPLLNLITKEFRVLNDERSFSQFFLSVVEAQMTDHVQMGQTSCMWLCTTRLHSSHKNILNLISLILGFRWRIMCRWTRLLACDCAKLLHPLHLKFSPKIEITKVGIQNVIY